MAYYLQMDGVDDYILTPSITFTEIIMDVHSRFSASGSIKYYFDARTTGASYLYSSGDSGTESFSATTIYKNGVAVTSGANFIDGVTGERFTVRALSAAQTTILHLFARFTLGQHAKADVFNIKVYNGATLVAHYDMTLGNVQDQSGNGNHATLTGGTWVSDATGATHNGEATLQGVSTITANATLIPAAITGSASLQGVANLSASATVTNGSVTGSASVLGVGTMTATGSIIQSANVSMVGVSTLSAIAAGLVINGDASLSGVGALYADGVSGVKIISVIDILGEYDFLVDISGESKFVIDITGELDSVIDIYGELEPITDIKGVIGMAIKNADISIYRGNDKDIRDTVKNKDGTPTNLSGASVRCLFKKRQLDAESLFEKSTPTGITITDSTNGVLVVHLSGSDTAIQQGRYFYTIKVTDVLGKTTTVSEGWVEIKA